VQCIDQKTYLAVFEEKLHSLRKLISDLERGLPSQASDQFIQGLRLIVEAVDAFLRHRLNNLKATLAGKPEQLEIQIAFNAKVALKILGSIHQQYLPLLHAESQRNEYLFYPSLERAISLFTDSSELTLVPDFEYNYAFDGREFFANREIELLEKHSDHGTKAALADLRARKSLKRWITFLHFPVADRDSALNLCILAHELGHFVDATNKIYQTILPIELDKSSFDELVATRCSTPASAVKSKPGDPQLTFETIFTRAGVQARCYLACNEMLGRWIQEIIADILAIHAIGPASYFAFNDFFAYMGAENIWSNSHPAPAFRLKLMLGELKDTMGYCSSESPIDNVLTEGATRVETSVSSTTYKDEARVVQKTIDRNLPVLLSKIRPVVSPYSFQASLYRDTVPKITARLRAGIAPIEIWDKAQRRMVPASIVAILNAGWELYKTDLDAFYRQFRPEVPEMDRLDNLNHLLFKAIEASEVMRRWK
jgi:hypothetical protein